MSAPPYMKLFWGDYHKATRHLTRDQHGAYFLLIGEAWRLGGSLPDDDQLLAAWALCSPDEWAEMKPIVTAFFALRRGKWVHDRVREELSHYETISRKRKTAGRAGGTATRGEQSEKPEAIAPQKPTKPEPEPEPDIENNILARLPFEAGEDPPPQRADHGAKRGARLKADWKPSFDNRAYAFSEGFSETETTRMAENFRDYWTAASGAKAAKLDWSAAWRTWVRNQRDRNPRRASGNRVAFV